MKTPNQNQKSLQNKLILGMLATTSLLAACAQTPFGFETMTADQKENYSSELLKQSLTRASIADIATPGVSVGNTGSVTSVGGSTTPPCQIGAFDLYQDKNLDGKLSDDEYLGPIASYSGAQSAAKNYGLTSASAHPKVGPQPEAFKSKLFLYSDSEGTHLTFFSNVDYDSAKAGSTHNKVAWDIAVTGKSLSDKVELSDDNLELKKLLLPVPAVYPPPPVTLNRYEARWEYWHNTDGGIIGPIKDFSSEVRIEMKQLGDIRSIEFASADGTVKKIANNSKPLAFVIRSRFDLLQTNNATTSPDGAVSSIPLCQPPEPDLSLIIYPVSNVDVLAYDQPCVAKGERYCPMLARLNDVLVSGGLSSGLTNGIGIIPVQKVVVQFSEMYLACEAEAKQALALKSPLVIRGKGVGVENATTVNYHFSEVTSCFVENLAKTTQK